MLVTSSQTIRRMQNNNIWINFVRIFKSNSFFPSSLLHILSNFNDFNWNRSVPHSSFVCQSIDQLDCHSEVRITNKELASNIILFFYQYYYFYQYIKYYRIFLINYIIFHGVCKLLSQWCTSTLTVSPSVVQGVFEPNLTFREFCSRVMSGRRPPPGGNSTLKPDRKSPENVRKLVFDIQPVTETRETPENPEKTMWKHVVNIRSITVRISRLISWLCAVWSSRRANVVLNNKYLNNNNICK